MAVSKPKIFSLDSYQEQADKDYGSYSIRVSPETVVVLLNPLRINQEKRDRLFEIIPEISTDGDEDKSFGPEDLKRLSPLIIEILQLVGDRNVDKLINAISGDFAVVMRIFQDYFKAVGLGEASVSEG